MDPKMLDEIDAAWPPQILTEEDRLRYRTKISEILGRYGVSEEEYDVFIESELDRLFQEQRSQSCTA